MPISSATRKRAASSTVAALAALTLGVAGAATPARAGASAAPDTPAGSHPAKRKTAADTSWSQLVTDTNFYLSVSGGRTDPGAPVIGWTLSPGSRSQAWTYYQIPGSDNYVIRSGNTSNWYALAISGGLLSTGTAAIQWNFEVTSSVAHPEQQWKMEPVLTPSGTQKFWWRNVNSYLCLTAGGLKGTGFTQETCEGRNRRQQFTSSVWY